MPKLTRAECDKILSELSNIKEISNKDLQLYIEDEMVKRGLSKGAETIQKILNRSLGILQNQKKVVKVQKGLWSFPFIDGKENSQIVVKKKKQDTEISKIEFEFKKIIGPKDSKQTVYLYYYPGYETLARLQNQDRWRCKVGKTDSIDPIYRIEEQIKTHIQEIPIAALMIRTQNMDKLEKAIHYILELNGHKCHDSIGTEWYFTNPDEVESLVKSMLKNTLTE